MIVNLQHQYINNSTEIIWSFKIDFCIQNIVIIWFPKYI